MQINKSDNSVEIIILLILSVLTFALTVGATIETSKISIKVHSNTILLETISRDIDSRYRLTTDDSIKIYKTIKNKYGF